MSQTIKKMFQRTRSAEYAGVELICFPGVRDNIHACVFC